MWLFLTEAWLREIPPSPKKVEVFSNTDLYLNRRDWPNDVWLSKSEALFSHATGCNNERCLLVISIIPIISEPINVKCWSESFSYPSNGFWMFFFNGWCKTIYFIQAISWYGIPLAVPALYGSLAVVVHPKNRGRSSLPLFQLKAINRLKRKRSVSKFYEQFYHMFAVYYEN